MASERIIAALGPKASFSDEAARNYLARTMQHARIEYCNSISSCYNAIKNAPDIAIVPILNSTAEASWINYTLAELKTNDLKICGEEILPVRMNLLALQEARLEDITEVCTIEKAFQQCNNYLNTHLQKAKRENASSTSAAAQLVKNSQNSKKAAIANALAAKTYGLETLVQNIQDNPHNVTRFIVLGYHEPLPTGYDRTTIILEYKDSSKQGILVDALQNLSSKKINLLYLQSVPNNALDDFTFYLDIEGHQKDPHVEEALADINKMRDISLLKIAGSYPRMQKKPTQKL